jgi:AcrR family transcriptional regulator
MLNSWTNQAKNIGGRQMVKEDQRTMLTKRLLKDSLVKLLKEKSIYKITVRELCEIADINRSTFYRYYENQFSLLGEMEEEILEHIYTNLDSMKGMGRQDNLDVLIVIMSMLEENVEFSRLLVNNSVDPEFPKRLLNSPQLKVYVENQVQGTRSPAEIEYLSLFLTFGCFRMVLAWINKKHREPVKEVAMMMNAFIGRLVR